MSCLPIYFNEMQKLPETAPEVHEEFAAGKFTVHQTAGDFNGVWTDLALEQTYNHHHETEGDPENSSDDPATDEDEDVSDDSGGHLTVCYDKIGCFGDGGIFYDPFKRPISKLPGSPLSINIEFGLYTRANRQKMEKLFMDDITVLNSSTFNPANEVKFIIHGYGSKGDNEWILNMTKELLVYADYNVIVVNWGKGARSPYSQATANTRVVGAWLAEFIKFLEVRTLHNGVGVKEENCHLIGHSLGAHASGYCGERLKSLGRISGLDPAYPMFEGMDKRVTLDSTDANFVDVIHTDGHMTSVTGFGVNPPLGHMDFYPNGGQSQPGCGLFKIFNLLFTDGFDEDHNYRLKLKTEAKPGSTDVSGSVFLSLDGTTSNLIDYKLYDGKTLKHPEVYYPIITSSTNLGPVLNGAVVWEDNSYWYRKLCFFCATRKLYIKNIEIRSIEASNTR
ncbi:Inactive pancreatic lipase-related protein 1 [Nymphon striatum]|nr:Inactive pancreatic lipase-related protein 1 [Nymphon striatum]